MPVLPFCAAIGFIAACVDWMVLCSGLLWCAVLWCWTREIRFLRFLVFPWYRRSFRRRWMAGSELNPSRVRVQLEKSPVRCWTGKSDGIGPVSFPAPLEFRLGLARRTGRWSLLRLFGTFCSVGKNPTESNKISNRTKLRTGQMEASKASRMFRAPMTSTPSHLEAERFFRPW